MTSRWLAPLIVTAVALLTLTVGYADRSYSTDPFSESLALEVAHAVVDGTSRYGVTSYTHYPNGTAYVLVPFVALGSDDDTLRLVPIVFAACGFAFWCWALLRRQRATVSQLLIGGGVMLLILAPGIRQWLADLHEHSYALTQAVIGISLCLVLPRPWWLLLGLGYAAGWTGYDFLPAQTLAISQTGLLVALVRSGTPAWRQSFRTATRAGLSFACGALLAIACHVGQNALFFGSIEEALDDLGGAALARAGAESMAMELNAEYQNHLNDVASSLAWGQSPTWRIVGGMGWTFLTGVTGKTMGHREWGPWWLTFPFIGLGLLIFLRGLGLLSRSAPSLPSSAPQAGSEHLRWRSKALGLTAALACVTGTAWYILMPQHALFHFHIIPRHLFVPLMVFLTGCVVLGTPPLPRAEEALPSNGRDAPERPRATL